MDIYAIWPFFVCIGLILAITATPLFHLIDSKWATDNQRVVTLDGLRGFLALSVVFHHAAIYHTYLLTGMWDLPPSNFYTLLGQVGVAVFFMITGYLFWAKLLQDNGRPDIRGLYIGRLFRIGPLYVFAALVMIVIVFSQTRWQIFETPPELANQLAQWLAFGFLGRGPILNDYADTRHVTAGVTWTLRLEWWFYISLALTMFVARIPRGQVTIWAIALMAALGFIAWRVQPGVTAPLPVCIALFLVGMLTASMERAHTIPRLPNRLASIIAVGLVAGVFYCFTSANSAAPIMLLGVAFFLIAQGCDVFGIMSCRAARRLGDISYGVYLLQGLVLWLIFSPSAVHAFALASPAQHWLAISGAAITLVAVAGVAHLGIERPGIALGRRIADRLRARGRRRIVVPDRLPVLARTGSANDRRRPPR